MLVVFIYVLFSAAFSAVTYLPTEADSLHYHIPLAEGFLQGNFGGGGYGNTIHMYFPAATETLLAVQMALGIPVGFFNVFGVLALVGSCFLLGQAYDLKKEAAITFAVTVGTLYGVVRWVHAQTVDIWLAAYYVAVVALLKRPSTNWSYFLNLGIFLGLLIGSKYSGPLFAIGLILVFGAHFWKFLRESKLNGKTNSNLRLQTSSDTYFKSAEILFSSNWIKVGAAGACTVGIGGFWYLRNWWVTGNPFFPLDTPFFAGVSGNAIIEVPIWKAYLLYPRQMLDGAVSEFMFWPVMILGMIVYLIYSWCCHKTKIPITGAVPVVFRMPEWPAIRALLSLALYNFAVFLLLPSGDSMQLHVSQYRFAYVVVIPLLLILFILSKKITAVAILMPWAVLSNFLVLTQFPYRPKLATAVILIPLSIIFLTKQHTASKK